MVWLNSKCKIIVVNIIKPKGKKCEMAGRLFEWIVDWIDVKTLWLVSNYSAFKVKRKKAVFSPLIWHF